MNLTRCRDLDRVTFPLGRLGSGAASANRESHQYSRGSPENRTKRGMVWVHTTSLRRLNVGTACNEPAIQVKCTAAVLILEEGGDGARWGMHFQAMGSSMILHSSRDLHPSSDITNPLEGRRSHPGTALIAHGAGRDPSPARRPSELVLNPDFTRSVPAFGSADRHGASQRHGQPQSAAQVGGSRLGSGVFAATTGAIGSRAVLNSIAASWEPTWRASSRYASIPSLQDHAKQDGGIAAAKRWLIPNFELYRGRVPVTPLGDDHYAHRPFCRQALISQRPLPLAR